MYFTLKAFARALILPPGLPLIVAVLGILLIWRRRRFGWPLLLAGVGSLWLLCTPIFSNMISRLAERYPAFDFSKPVDAQVIVVIGGGMERVEAPEYHGPAADDVLLERLAYAAFLSRRLSLPVLVSGAPGEAYVMRTTLMRDFGITPRWVEGHSRDTYQNAHFSQHLLQADGVKRIILVTSSTHEWRAAHEFMEVGLDVTPAPSGVLARREVGVFAFVPGPAALSRSNAAVYELIGEQMRRLQSAVGIREKFDQTPTAGPDWQPAPERSTQVTSPR